MKKENLPFFTLLLLPLSASAQANDSGIGI